MKDVKRLLTCSALCIVFSALMMGSCSDDDNPITDLELSELKLEFAYIDFAKTVSVSGNNQNVVVSTSVDWCTVSYADGNIEVSVSTNRGRADRTTQVSVEANGLKKSISIKQSGFNGSQIGVKDDILIKVKSGEASAFQRGQDIDKSFDGDMSTLYHSPWGNVNVFPVTLTYNFENTTTMDYLIYYPRSSGSNGSFKEFELWVATESQPELKKIGDYDFKGSPSAGRITFETALIKPTKVQFVVKSGMGDNDHGYVSCAEMQFYKKNPESFDYLTIFTDITCSALKSGITQETVSAIEHPFYRSLATELLLGNYDTEFRVQNYKAWQSPDVMAKANKTGTYGLRDNPTGIYAGPSEELMIFVGNTKGQNISLFQQNVNDKVNGTSYALVEGANKIKMAHSGLLYMMYYTDTGKEAPIKVHIARGKVNGYFDTQKHKMEDWSTLLEKASFKHFDVMGKHVVMTFETNAFRQFTPNGTALVNRYDDLMALEQDFMGLNKYNRQYNNRLYFLVIYDSYMYAASNYTAYVNTTQKDLLNVNNLSTNSCWGPAHEVGHVHQTRPGFRWSGMTEVTNNIHSLYIQTEWGNQSRLISDGYYNDAATNLLKKGIAHNAYKGTNLHFVKLVPFWQLKLYMDNVLGKKDFYKDIYEEIRKRENVNTSTLTEGYYQLDFVRLACQSANLNLLDFFEAWGFLTPMDENVEDYGTARFTIKQEQIEALKAEIEARNYPMPRHNNIFDIRDNNLDSYK